MVVIEENSQILKLTLELPGSVNHIYGRNKFGSTYLKTEGKDYKKRMIKLIQKEVQKQSWTKAENQFLYMDEVIFMNKKGRDADNLKKLTQDCITESSVVWTDDTYCWARTQRVFIDKVNPRLELILTQSSTIGIFDSKKEYDEFINTYCSKCKNGDKLGQKGGCTIYKDSLENRIRKEIPMTAEEDRKNKKCLRFKEIKKK